MPTQKKIDTVDELRQQIAQSQITVATDYRGLSVTELGRLRVALRDAGVNLRVVKNRLFLRAANDAGQPELAELLDGPTAIAFGYDDIGAMAKALAEYERTSRTSFAIRKGALNGQVLSAADVKDLAELPSREVLIGMVAGALQSPIARLVGLLSNALANPPGRLLHDSFSTFTGLVEARAKQLEGA